MKKENMQLNIPGKSTVVSYRYGDFMSKFSIQYWKEFFKQRTMLSKMFLILMQLRNGKYAMFTVTTNESIFDYNGASYMIDVDAGRDDIHTGLTLLYYHQDCMSPMRIEFSLNDLVKELETHAPDVVKTINPRNIRGFIASQVIEKVLKGQELSDDIKFLRTLIIINLLVTGVMVVVLGKSIGWF